MDSSHRKDEETIEEGESGNYCEGTRREVDCKAPKGGDFMILLLILIVLVLVVAASCVKIVPQAHAVILERLGAYQSTWGVGIHFKIPFIERIAKKVNLKEQVVDFPPQPVITKDNVTMQIDTVVFFQITDLAFCLWGGKSNHAIETSPPRRCVILSVIWSWMKL